MGVSEFMQTVAFALAFFMAGYALGKDTHNTQKMRPVKENRLS